MFLTTFFKKTTNVEVLGMVKKIQAARELRMRATMKRRLYRQGKTTDVMLVSRTHLTEVLDTLLFIFRLFLDLLERRERRHLKRFRQLWTEENNVNTTQWDTTAVYPETSYKASYKQHLTKFRLAVS